MSVLWLLRHGETLWSAAGRHTGRTDLPLTERGEQQAQCLRRQLESQQFALVLTSPLRRARDTCRLAGCGEAALVDDDLAEWDYGGYEGLTSAEIAAEQPGWTLWTGKVRGGESAEQVGTRSERVIARALAVPGNVALFAHGHLLKILAARWLGLSADMGRLLALDTASISVLGLEREQRVIRQWNDTSHLSHCTLT